MNVDDKEVLKVMLNGANEVCDNAIGKWFAGKYGTDQELIRDNVKRWNNIKKRINKLIQRLRETVECDTT